MSKTHVIVGGGLTGLYAAKLLADCSPRDQIVLVEKASGLGGLLRGFDYGEFGRFDCGTHIFQEIGDPAIDERFLSLLPPDDWIFLEGARRDLAGIFHQSRFQEYSPLVDLRPLPPDDYRKCLGGLFASLNRESREAEGDDAYSLSVAQYGEPIAERIVAPILRKIFHHDPRKLAPLALRLAGLSRLILFDEEITRDLMRSEKMRSIIGYPDQKNLPSQYIAHNRSFYPVGGNYKIIEGFRDSLLEKGVTLLNNAVVDTLDIVGNQVASLSIKTGDVFERIERPESIIWSSGLLSLAGLLGLKADGMDTDKPLHTIILNFVLNEPPAPQEVYYFYCYDNGYSTFRVTLYSNFCENVAQKAGYPLTVEIITPSIEDEGELVSKIFGELKCFGVVGKGAQVLFSKVEVLPNGFPLPTIKNFLFLSDIREKIRRRKIKNIIISGVLSEKDVFFHRDVLTDVHKKIMSRSNAD